MNRYIILSIYIFSILLYISPFFANNWRHVFSESNYPEYFLNLDNAWYLQFVHSLQHELKFTPNYLGAGNFGIAYQYLPAFLSYCISEVFHICAHSSLFVFLPAIALTLSLRYYYLISRLLFSSSILSLFFFVLLLFFKPVNLLSKSSVFSSYFSDGITFGLARDEQLASLFGHCLIVAFMFYMFKTILFGQTRINNILMRLILLLLLFTKASYFMPLFVFFLVRILLDFNLKTAFWDLLILAVYLLVLKFYVNPLSDFNPGDGLITGYYESNKLTMGLFGSLGPGSVVYYFLLIFLCWYQIHRWEKLNIYLFIILVIICTGFSIFSIGNLNSRQLFDPFLIFYSVFISYTILKSPKITAKYIPLVTLVVLSVFMNVFGGLRYVYAVTNDIKKGFQYVDNKDIADVLKSVPVKGTLLIINDNRYPLDNFARPNRQFQCSGIFGHKFFNSELQYSSLYFKGNANDRLEFFKERVRYTNYIQGDNFNKIVLEELKNIGVTHILIYKKYKHFDYQKYKLTIVSENPEFALISLI